MDLISKATRIEFRETLVKFVLRQIDMFFEGAGLIRDEHYIPQIDGERRIRVEEFYANIDFTSPSDVNKLLVAFGEIFIRMSQTDDFDDITKDNLLRLMNRDGYEFDGESFVAIPSKEQPLVESIRLMASSFDLPALQVVIGRLVRASEDDPALAVGTAKEMVETICKTILDDREVSSQGLDLPQLVRAVSKELTLLPEDIPDRAKGSKVIRRILSNLNQVSEGIAELRNLYGTGHGRDGRFTGLQPRHAKLAVGSAATLGSFLMETQVERSKVDSAATMASDQ